jgi:hypothetical protein
MSITVRDKMTLSLQKLDREIRSIMPKAYKVWVQNTPKDQGGAKSKTSLKGNTIHANYQYADKLDDGYSPKSPNGMSQPTTDFITEQIKSLRK